MDFRKTTVLPLDTADEARRLFQKRVDEALVLFVVLGTGTAREDMVSKAGQLAGADDEARWVVWARSLDDIKPAIAKFSESSPGFLDTILSGRAQAFVTSLDDQVRDVILASEAISNVRIFQAYGRAESL